MFLGVAFRTLVSTLPPVALAGTAPVLKSKGLVVAAIGGLPALFLTWNCGFRSA